MKKSVLLSIVLVMLLAVVGCTNPYMSQAFATVENKTTTDLYVSIDSKVVLVPAGTTSEEVQIGFCYQSTPVLVYAGKSATELISLGQVEAHFGEVFAITVDYDTLQSRYYFTSAQTYK